MNAINKDAINAYDLEPDLLLDADFLKAASKEDRLQLKEYTISHQRSWSENHVGYVKVKAFSEEHAVYIMQEYLYDGFFDEKDGWYSVDTDYHGCDEDTWIEEVKNAAV